MNFSEQLIYLVDELASRIGIAIDWTSQNAFPYLQDLVQRYINYMIFSDVVWTIVSIGILGLAIYGAKKFLGQRRDYIAKHGGSFSYSSLDTFGHEMGIAGCAVVTIITGILIIFKIIHLAQLFFVPEMIIYQELVQLIQ